jgi:hypothetical protein
MTIVVDRATRIKLVAIAYHMGQKGLYSRPAKIFLNKGMEDYMANLTPKQQAAYDEIMMNVQVLADQGALKGVCSLEEYKNIVMKKIKRPRRN